MDHNSIDFIHRTKAGKLSDKWASYLVYYDNVLIPFRNENISLLEIGVQNGGSLETWSTYFNNANLLIGCDIDPKCGELVYNDPRVKVVVGDANSAQTIHAIRELSSYFDVIIDDGSHQSVDIINSFINYFPILKSGGLYIIEDSHTLYSDSFGGGIINELSAYSFFKKIVDLINFQFWRNDLSIHSYLRTFFPHDQTPNFLLEGWIDSITFRNSIITITKSKEPSHEKLGDRLIVGEEAAVQTWGGAFGSVKSNKVI
jgi:hypothetical protein